MDTVELDSEASAAGQRNRFAHSSLTRCSVLLQQSKRPTRIRSDFVQPRLFAVELFDNDEGKHHLVFVESENGVRIGEEDAGVENECALQWAPL